VIRKAGVLLVAAALALTVVYIQGHAETAAGSTALGPGLVTVKMRVEHSRFIPDHVVVRPGTTVVFEITDTDPIDHEFIVGPQAVHDAHEQGTQKHHPPVPGETSIPAGGTGTTFYQFTATGPMLFACHLPGHFAYGMRGTVEVTNS
jgi:uncharacterized cupredoxin-like copper-binding protein